MTLARLLRSVTYTTLLEKVAKLALASTASLSVRDQITGISDNLESESLGSFPSVYPNPFNESAKIIFYLNVSTQVKIKIYNLKGQLITTLLDGYFQPGLHEISWHNKNNASGIYFCLIQSQYFNYSLKITHIK